MPFVRRKKQSIDYAPIQQTPFADYWAGEHAVTNDPALGPWSPEEYEKYKGTTKAEWLREHPEDWTKRDLFTAPWAERLLQNLEPLGHALGAVTGPLSGRKASEEEKAAALALIKGIPGAIAAMPGNLVEQFKDPVRYWGEHPESALFDIATLLGVAGAGGKGAAQAGERMLPGATTEATAAKALPEFASPNVMTRKYDYLKSFRDEPAFNPVSMGESFEDVAKYGLDTRKPIGALPSGARPMWESQEIMARKFEPGMLSANELLAARQEQFANQLLEKLQRQLKALPSGAPVAPGTPGFTGGATGATPVSLWPTSKEMARKYGPLKSPTDQPVFKTDIADYELGAALKEVDDVLLPKSIGVPLSEARSKYATNLANIEKLLDTIYKMIGKQRP